MCEFCHMIQSKNNMIKNRLTIVDCHAMSVCVTSCRADIALIGLAVMGQNLILNMNDHGFVVSYLMLLTHSRHLIIVFTVSYINIYYICIYIYIHICIDRNILCMFKILCNLFKGLDIIKFATVM